MSERSQASCKVTKLRLAAATKPSVSKPAGTPQFCEPARAEPICTPLPWPYLPASNAMLLRSQGRAEASLPTLSGLYWRGGWARSAGAPAPCSARPPRGWAPARPHEPAERQHDDQHHQGDQQELAEGRAQAQRMGQPGQPQTGGQAAEHGAPGTLGSGGRSRIGARLRCRRCLVCIGGRGGRARGLALGHVARLPADRAAAAQAAGRVGLEAGQRQDGHEDPGPEFHIVSMALNRASALDSNMQCHHAAREVVIVHMAETTFLHQRLQLFLRRMHPDRLRQVAVAGVVAGHQLAQPRQHLERIPVVGLFQRLGHPGKLQHQQFAAAA